MSNKISEISELYKEYLDCSWYEFRRRNHLKSLIAINLLINYIKLITVLREIREACLNKDSL